jgi:hypothetical protein
VAAGGATSSRIRQDGDSRHCADIANRSRLTPSGRTPRRIRTAASPDPILPIRYAVTLWLGAADAIAQLKRREFISLLGAAATWPLSLRAQSKVRSIGYLGSGSQSAQGPWIAAFVQRMRELGWIEGATFVVENRWAEGRSERYAEIAAEFVRLNVAVILTEVAASAAKRATATIPIVFAVAGDPVGAGLVASLARPGGNVTGLSIQQPELAGKRLRTHTRGRSQAAAGGGPCQHRQQQCRAGNGRGQTAARTLGLEIPGWKSDKRAILHRLRLAQRSG